MDNQQFRRLLIGTQAPGDGAPSKSPASRSSGAVLGARKQSSIPMTPRQVGRSSIQADFARQLAERNAKTNPSKRKFRSAAPKGTKLAAGYTDRTKDRVDDEEDETAQRIKNLEEAMKEGQLDRETFEKLVQDITGGEIGSTHLVKGLDRKLLERVRKGENVFGGEKNEEDGGEGEEAEDEFDELAEQPIGPIIREKEDKKGEMAPPPPVAGVKRSRNDILAELKRQREEAAAAAAAEHEKKYPTLGPGFRKLNARGETSRIEVDAKGREVLIITDADGKEKRKVKKHRVEEPLEIRRDIDDEKKPINMHNLPAPKPAEESEDEDIFEGVGSSYNPLANLDDEDESEEEALEPKEGSRDDGTEPNASEPEVGLTADSANPPSKRRDYFVTTRKIPSNQEGSPGEQASSADATIRAALQKVRTLDASSTLLAPDPDSKEARLQKRAAELAAADRDMEDMDMGFGASRFDDAEEMEREGEKVKFSEWRGIGAEEDEDEDGGKGAGKKRKRGPKKKKGDKNSASDVLKVMERQKEKKTLG